MIASYRPGDPIRKGVEVLAIEDGVVELSNDGEVEYLTYEDVKERYDISEEEWNDPGELIGKKAPFDKTYE